jgi:hypothetical protein
MDAPVETKTVVVGPGLSVAAQAATVIADQRNEALPSGLATVKPSDVVDRDFLESIGMRTKGWVKLGGLFWRQHSVQFWTAAAALETTLQVAQGWIPERWATLGHGIALVLSWLGILFKARLQGGLIVARIRGEVERHTA